MLVLPKVVSKSGAQKPLGFAMVLYVERRSIKVMEASKISFSSVKVPKKCLQCSVSVCVRWEGKEGRNIGAGSQAFVPGDSHSSHTERGHGARIDLAIVSFRSRETPQLATRGTPESQSSKTPTNLGPPRVSRRSRSSNSRGRPSRHDFWEIHCLPSEALASSHSI